MIQEMTHQALIEFIRGFSQALSVASLYHPDHPRVASLLPRVVTSLHLARQSEPELCLIVFNDDLLYLGKPLAREPNVQKLAKCLARAGVGHISFGPAVAVEGFASLVRALAERGDLQGGQGNGNGIRIGNADVSENDSGQAEMISSFSDISPEKLRELQSIYDAIACCGSIDTRQLMSLVAGFIVAFRREYNPLMALAPIRSLDEYTFTHSINVGILNIAQGMSLGITGELLHDLGVAGMLHDAGKIFVDRAIIQKPGGLDDDEFAIMQTHPSRGAQYLMGQEGVPKLAVISAFEHHMRHDLKGYPVPPPGWRLNLCSEMTMISDTFDALRTKRVYKDSWDFPAVCGRLLELAGNQLNGDLTVNFVELLSRLGDGLPPSQLDNSMPTRNCYCE